VAAQGDRVCAAVGRDPADAAEEWESPAHVDAPSGITVKIATSPASIVGTVRSVLTKLKETQARLGPTPLLVAGHLGAGIARFHLAIDGDTAPAGSAPYAAFSQLWGATAPDGVLRSRVLERAPLSIKKSASVWGDAPASLPLMRSIKRRFDPDNVLAPGRFVGGL
jgi:glycolate oxidase FAD binding subunit